MTIVYRSSAKQKGSPETLSLRALETRGVLQQGSGPATSGVREAGIGCGGIARPEEAGTVTTLAVKDCGSRLAARAEASLHTILRLASALP